MIQSDNEGENPVRVKIMQPPYPEKGEALKVLDWQIQQLQNLVPGSTDLVIFPENANCTGYTDLENMKEKSNIFRVGSSTFYCYGWTC